MGTYTCIIVCLSCIGSPTSFSFFFVASFFSLFVVVWSFDSVLNSSGVQERNSSPCMPPKDAPTRQSKGQSRCVSSRASTNQGDLSRSPSSLAALSPSPARHESEDEVRNTGVYVYINGLLCRTADNTGCFCPSDVFGGVDRCPVSASLPVPSFKDDDNRRILLRAAEDSGATAMTCESDCPIFNTFGVLTGGVLINPFDGTFADYTQTTPCTLAGVAPSSRSSSVWWRQTEARQAAADAVRLANEFAFRRGDFAHIRPITALTLCTSELPLPPPTPSSEASSEPYFPASENGAAVRPAPSRPPLRRQHFFTTSSVVDSWYDRLAVPGDVTLADAAQYKAVWQDAEAFRQALMHDSVSRAMSPPGFFPPSVPFLYRERGTPLCLEDEQKERHLWDTSLQDADGAGDAADVPLPGVRSAAAAFVCYSGQPRFVRDQCNPSREKTKEQRAPPLPMRLQKRLRPYDAAKPARVPVQRRLEPNSVPDASVGAPRDRLAGEESSENARNDNEVEQDVEECFLTPYSSDHPRESAFNYFLVYFNHLGLLRNGTRITGETEATSVRELKHHERYTWDLCPEAAYDVAAEVRRKRLVTRALWTHAAKSFPGGSRWSTTGGNIGVVSIVFAALMASHRDALLQRISTLNAYLHKLHETAPDPIQ